jgi:transposase
VVTRVQQVIEAGGKVWVGDETTLREFPPLRSAWAKRGKQQVVVISGRNGRRVIHGALNIQTGELVRIVRERSRTDDAQAFVEALGKQRPERAKLLIWDNAPPHHPKRVLEAALAAKIEIAWLPFRSPELNPCEDLWRLLKSDIAANRVYSSLEEEAERALAWLDRLPNDERLRRCGLRSSKFQWLST